MNFNYRIDINFFMHETLMDFPIYSLHKQIKFHKYNEQTTQIINELPLIYHSRNISLRNTKSIRDEAFHSSAGTPTGHCGWESGQWAKVGSGQKWAKVGGTCRHVGW